MNTPRDFEESEIDDLFTSGDLTTLVDLQKFLAEELTEGAQKGVDFTRAFTPLTDGLGIHGSAKPQPTGAQKAGAPAYVPPAPRVTEFRSVQPLVEKKKSSARMIVDSDYEGQMAAQAYASEFEMTSPPPPVPLPGAGRRFFAGVVDQCFVFAATLLTLAITSNAMADSHRFLNGFSNPAFVRSAMLEYAMIWLGYLVLSLGVLEMTFGMWVWGLRVSYGDVGRGWKKVARIVMGMFIYPWIAPAVLLLFQKDGQHLIDAFSQSQVYRTGDT